MFPVIFRVCGGGDGKQTFKPVWGGLWDLVGAGGKQQRKNLSAIPVRACRDWKASCVFSPLWELDFFVMEDNTTFCLAVWINF